MDTFVNAFKVHFINIKHMYQPRRLSLLASLNNMLLHKNVVTHVVYIPLTRDDLTVNDGYDAI